MSQARRHLVRAWQAGMVHHSQAVMEFMWPGMMDRVHNVRWTSVLGTWDPCSAAADLRCF